MKKDILGHLIAALFRKDRAQCQMEPKRSKTLFQSIQDMIQHKSSKKGTHR